MFAPAVEERRKPAAASPECISSSPVGTASDDQPPVMTSVPAPEAKTGGTSRLIKPRERAACPQLRCVPPDLRGDGARHASRESLPPSKPFRPRRNDRYIRGVPATDVFIVTGRGESRQMPLPVEVVVLALLDFIRRAPA